MERMTDWSALWRELVEVQIRTRGGGDRDENGRNAPWRTSARDFDARAKRRLDRADAIRDFVASRVDSATTVLDIGAGTGRWAIYLARRAHKVTAVEPSPAMLAVLKENLAAEGINNVEVIEGFWPEVSVEPHDISLCSHAMYFSKDLPAFVNRMAEVSRRACYLVLRVATHDGVMAKASQRVWGHPHDSPNFAVAYNVLLQMGIYANVLVDHTLWRPWTSPTLDAALADIKQRLELGENSEHDGYLRELLSRRLMPDGDGYLWPQGVRSALVYWNVSSQPA